MGDPIRERVPLDLEIRLATAHDHRVIRELYYEGVLAGRVHLNDTGADIENIQEGYFADEGESGFWVATLVGEVVGMVGVQKISEHTAEIRRLRVSEVHRRKGIGTRLMEHATAFCRQRGYLKVALDVQMDRGPAIALFEKSGFKLSRTREINGRKLLDFFLDLYSEPEVGGVSGGG